MDRSGGGRLRQVPKLLGNGLDFVERLALFLEVFLEEADRLALAERARHLANGGSSAGWQRGRGRASLLERRMSLGATTRRRG